MSECIKTFTFLSITYNHEAYILEHLESILALIKNYGAGIDFHLVLMDDCSSDSTVTIAREWLEDNKAFYHYQLVTRDKNVGTVQNIIEGLKRVTTDAFKHLAGDDVFLDENIFEVFNHMEQRLYISKTVPFGGGSKKTRWFLAQIHDLAKYAESRGRFKDVQRIYNLIAAPGVFFPVSFLEDGLYTFLEDYYLMEDIPMWYYFLQVKGYDATVLDKSYVGYRIGQGISSASTHEKAKAYVEDIKKASYELDMKAYQRPFIINPHMYFVVWQWIKSKIHKRNKRTL